MTDRLNQTGWGEPWVNRLKGQTSLHYFRNGRSICPRRYTPRYVGLHDSLVAAGARLDRPYRRLEMSCTRCRTKREREVGVADA